jgi:hypothetical protein
MLLLSESAMAHLWYESECCDDEDCSVVLRKLARSDGVLITTSQGTALFPFDFPIRSSQDGREHACMGKGLPTDEGYPTKEPICLYKPPEF